MYGQCGHRDHSTGNLRQTTECQVVLHYHRLSAIQVPLYWISLKCMNRRSTYISVCDTQNRVLVYSNKFCSIVLQSNIICCFDVCDVMCDVMCDVCASIATLVVLCIQFKQNIYLEISGDPMPAKGDSCILLPNHQTHDWIFVWLTSYHIGMIEGLLSRI